jgi:hypothetical protein
MPTFHFNWHCHGSVTIEANTIEAACEIANDMALDDLTAGAAIPHIDVEMYQMTPDPASSAEAD